MLSTNIVKEPPITNPINAPLRDLSAGSDGSSLNKLQKAPDGAPIKAPFPKPRGLFSWKDIRLISELGTLPVQIKFVLNKYLHFSKAIW